MNKATDPVLELLDEHGLALPPGAIAFNLDRLVEDAPSEPTVSRAIRRLREHGFIEKAHPDHTYYAITDRGRAYLAGELDAGEINE
jgi:DNA-binding PadR family transcriptional regulator